MTNPRNLGDIGPFPEANSAQCKDLSLFDASVRERLAKLKAVGFLKPVPAPPKPPSNVTPEQGAPVDHPCSTCPHNKPGGCPVVGFDDWYADNSLKMQGLYGAVARYIANQVNATIGGIQQGEPAAAALVKAVQQAMAVGFWLKELELDD